MNINFTGINQNIKIGRQSVRQVRQDFPFGFVSNSRYKAFSNKVNPKMDMFLSQKIYDTREMIAHQERLGFDGLTATEYAVRQTGAANCGEQARILSKKLNENNIPNKIVTLDIRNGNNYVDGHTFCVIGLKEGCKISDPKTWGKDAVIADMWLHSVDKADKLINQILDILNYDKRENRVVFYEPFIL